MLQLNIPVGCSIAIYVASCSSAEEWLLPSTGVEIHNQSINFAGHILEGSFHDFAECFWKVVLFCCMLFRRQCITLRHIAMVGYLVYNAFWKGAILLI